MTEILNKLEQVWNQLILKGGIILSAILALFLTAIGFPKSVIYFILFLMIADILTRWFSIIYSKYGKFNLSNFYQAWKEHILNSKKLKAGFFVKVFFYAILLVIAHQASIVPELAFGQVISNFMYSMIIILDAISVIENIIDCGFHQFSPLLKFFKNRKSEIIKPFDDNAKTEE